MRLLLKLAGGVLLVVVLIQGVLWYLVSREFAQTAEGLRPAAELQYGATFAWLTGNFGMRDVRLGSPLFGDGDISAQRVEIRTSGPIALFSLLLADDREAVEDVAFDIRRMRLGAALEQALREEASRLGYLAPYEALGCNDRGRFSGTEYAELGWLQANVDIEARMRRDIDRGTLALSLSYDMQPLSRFDLALDLEGMPEEGWIGSSIGAGLRVERAEIRYHDRGMLAHRNAFCAQTLGIDEAAFLERHIAAVADELESRGIFPDFPVTALYRDFARRGGTLVATLAPSAEVAFADYRHYAPADRLRLLNAGLQLNDGPLVPVTARFFGEGVGTDAAAPPDATDTVRVLVDPTDADRLLFEELSDLVGRRISVKTHGGQVYVGTLLGTQGPLVRLEIVRRSGQAQRLALSRQTIEAMHLLD